MSLLLVAAMAWEERGPEGIPTGAELDAATRLAPAEAPWGDLPPKVDPDLLAVMASARAWLAWGRGDPAVTAGLPGELPGLHPDPAAALDLLLMAANVDAADGGGRLADPAWWSAHLQYVRWIADQPGSGAPGQIRLTRYVVWQVDGSAERARGFDTALYAVPDDDAGPAPSRLKYSRQQVYAGVYEPGGGAAGLARPLVWLPRAQVDQAILQGTVEVRLPDGSTHIYNVHRSNEIPYDRAVRDVGRQQRYWYFREVDGVLGYHHGEEEAVRIRPQVTVAGDVFNLGLGRLILLDLGGTPRLTVLGDTGGAFQPNLHQLDLFVGAFPDPSAYTSATDGMSDYVSAGFLLPRVRP